MIVAEQWLKEGSNICRFSSASEPSHLSLHQAGTYLEYTVKGEGRAKWIQIGIFGGCGQDLLLLGVSQGGGPRDVNCWGLGETVRGDGDCSQADVRAAGSLR